MTPEAFCAADPDMRPASGWGLVEKNANQACEKTAGAHPAEGSD